MRLQFDSNNLSVFGQLRDHSSETRLNSGAATVDQYQRLSFAVNFIIHMQAIHFGKVVQGKQEIAPGYGYFAIFEDTEGNLLALQGDS